MEQVFLGMATGQLVLLAGSEQRVGLIAGWDTPFSWLQGVVSWQGSAEVCGTCTCTTPWCHNLYRARAAWTEAILRRGGCEKC